ncbi:DeoR faimly transcriptional regulator [Paenibacillus sp. FSL R7-0273]|uniref:DeoR/GlpR family DNA-binding transcription regulator n=1 Tax=Paenibacillus sp. FSL R7-0273 TaxID=1536772 RepID=UPI0004F796E9|nr:DeoR/GlpR family DNA-binding transcription regulator [Paenibacillus sp. FSL R7-0273]AIQ46613.1 DeoR faimly transcriptional regulator [Paenibacillus sp. FSL R7-0273]OMF97615.1 DeoR family transcriptional regulator [Paenibacillus sp. FSL R7-0273]
MNPMRRHEMIMKVILNRKNVTVNELSDKLQVTGKTIREDLSRLEEQGLIQRIHGGAVLAQSDQFGILGSRQPLDKHAAEKIEIALLALTHIVQDDIIALDGGSTTLEIARRLDNMPLTVITNDVYIISELVRKDQIRLVVPGGYRVRNILAGPEAAAYVQSLNIEKAFLSATAIHITHGLSVYTGDSLDYKQALTQTARKVFATADHHKFGQVALRTFASLEQVDVILTDKGLSQAAAEQYRQAGVVIECG